MLLWWHCSTRRNLFVFSLFVNPSFHQQRYFHYFQVCEAHSYHWRERFFNLSEKVNVVVGRALIAYRYCSLTWSQHSISSQPRMIYFFFLFSLILQSDISCRSYHVIVGFLSQFTVWLHVALMIELFVISVFPKRLNSVSSNERAHFLTLLLLTLLLIINMNYFWTIKRQTVSHSLLF